MTPIRVLRTRATGTVHGSPVVTAVYSFILLDLDRVELADGARRGSTHLSRNLSRNLSQNPSRNQSQNPTSLKT